MTTPKSYTVPSGVASANFLCSGLASRLPTPKICGTLDNVPGTVHLDEVCRKDEVLTFEMFSLAQGSGIPGEEQRSCAVVRWRLPLGWAKAAA